jgi:formate dehydrogenase iron-sulfur subunit
MSSTLINELLQEQQRLTPAERFAQHHERGELPAQAKFYRDLIPLTQPGPGQQYAFEVDLDKCSGCKACVSACHNLNGLDDGEMWRTTGLLISQDWVKPFQRTVTTACHHCADPGCLNGCPVLAYEKDPVTGIVRHLDDQCIGCQYCVMKCPYDVPKYLPERGIVRKCDMCADRLATNEAPACVQACPSEAIRIVVRDTEEIGAFAERGEFLPSAPDPGYTQPSTRYKSNRRLPKNLVAGDHVSLKPADSHLPLVFMLVLSQLAVGTNVAAAFTEPSTLLLLLAACAGTVAPVAGLLHLGKPLKAWRAFLGWRTSWFSREVIVFGAFVPVISGALLSTLAGWKTLALVLKIASGLIGVAGVACSAMIYVDTRREFWRASHTFGKFFASTLLLGAAATLAIQIYDRVQTRSLIYAAMLLMAATVAKLALELPILLHLEKTSGIRPQLRNTTMLLIGRLRPVLQARLACAALGGAISPFLIAAGLFHHGATLTIAVGAILICLTGELLERYLFFTAVAPERMPGGIAA